MIDMELQREYEQRFKPQYCGRFSLQGDAVDGTETRYVRLGCRCWGCQRCGPRKAGQYKHLIRNEAERLKLRRFLTLTLDPKKLSGQCPVSYLRDCFAKFRTYLKRKYREAPQYIAVLEFQKNGNPHLHILIDRFVDKRWIESIWQSVGGGQQIDIKLVDLHRVSRYLSKYLTKEMLVSAPKRSRRVTTSRGIKLFRRPERRSHIWMVRKIDIEILFRRLEAVARDVCMDQENQIESFSVQRTSQRSHYAP